MLLSRGDSWIKYQPVEHLISSWALQAMLLHSNLTREFKERGRFRRLLSLNTWLSSACDFLSMGFMKRFWTQGDIFAADGIHLNTFVCHPVFLVECYTPKQQQILSITFHQPELLTRVPEVDLPTTFMTADLAPFWTVIPGPANLDPQTSVTILLRSDIILNRTTQFQIMMWLFLISHPLAYINHHLLVYIFKNLIYWEWKLYFFYF